jgi:hypothetical protein
MFRKCGVKKQGWACGLFCGAYDGLRPMSAPTGQKKSPDVEPPGLWYLDLISVVNWAIKIEFEMNTGTKN